MNIHCLRLISTELVKNWHGLRFGEGWELPLSFPAGSKPPEFHVRSFTARLPRIFGVAVAALASIFLGVAISLHGMSQNMSK